MHSAHEVSWSTTFSIRCSRLGSPSICPDSLRMNSVALTGSGSSWGEILIWRPEHFRVLSPPVTVTNQLVLFLLSAFLGPLQCRRHIRLVPWPRRGSSSWSRSRCRAPRPCAAQAAPRRSCAPPPISCWMPGIFGACSKCAHALWFRFMVLCGCYGHSVTTDYAVCRLGAITTMAAPEWE